MLQSIAERESITPPADGLTLVDADGAPLPVEEIAVVRCVKAEPGEPRQAYRVTIGGRPALMKVRQLRDVRGRVKASWGSEYLRREQKFLEEAARRRLPVARCLGHGWRRRYGLVVEQVLLLEWHEEYRVLRDAARDRFACVADRHARTALLDVLADLFVAIRRAGIADKDFGAHNILVRDDVRPTPYLWIDLERCIFAKADDQKAQAEMTGSALASWWVATGGSIDALLIAWDELRRRTLESGQPWTAATKKVDREMRNKIAKLIARQWIGSAPPRGILKRLAAA